MSPFKEYFISDIAFFIWAFPFDLSRIPTFMPKFSHLVIHIVLLFTKSFNLLITIISKSLFCSFNIWVISESVFIDYFLFLIMAHIYVFACPVIFIVSWTLWMLHCWDPWFFCSLLKNNAFPSDRQLIYWHISVILSSFILTFVRIGLV